MFISFSIFMMTNKLQDFGWQFHDQDRVRSKVQVLKDAHIYLRELEKRVDPQLLRELQINFNQYRDQEESSCVTPELGETEPVVEPDKSQGTALATCKPGEKKGRVETVPEQVTNGMMGDQDQLHSCKRMFTQTTTYHEYEWAEGVPPMDFWGPGRKPSGAYYIQPLSQDFSAGWAQSTRLLDGYEQDGGKRRRVS